MTDAVIYARQSEDKTGEAAAVGRQIQLCRDLCAERGWTIATEYVDNDRSATSGIERPAFENLIKAAPRRVVVWHIDRLIRLTRDLERIIDTGANVHAVRAGHIDLSNPAGRAVARTVTAWSTYEGEQKADRQKAANRQRAAAGKPRWTRRPFGFARDGDTITVVKDEASELRAAYRKILSGKATLSNIAEDWNRRGVQTTLGGTWKVTPVRRVLLNPRLVGRTVYRGEDMGKTGPSIVTAEEFDRMRAKLTDPARRKAPSTQVKYLLSGLARCGTCDAPMFATNTSTARTGKYSVYRCLQCKRTRKREYVDAVVEGVVLARLERPDAARLLSVEVDVAALQDQVVELRDRRDQLAGMLAAGILGAVAVKEQAELLTEQITDLERKIDDASGTSPVASLVGADDVRAAWDSLSLLARRQVVKALMTVRIDAAGKGARFDPETVRIEWKGAS